MRLIQLLALSCALMPWFAQGAVVNVAVSANFTGPMERIGPAFEQATGHKAAIAY